LVGCVKNVGSKAKKDCVYIMEREGGGGGGVGLRVGWWGWGGEGECVVCIEKNGVVWWGVHGGRKEAVGGNRGVSKKKVNWCGVGDDQVGSRGGRDNEQSLIMYLKKIL